METRLDPTQAQEQLNDWMMSKQTDKVRKEYRIEKEKEKKELERKFQEVEANAT